MSVPGASPNGPKKSLPLVPLVSLAVALGSENNGTDQVHRTKPGPNQAGACAVSELVGRWKNDPAPQATPQHVTLDKFYVNQQPPTGHLHVNM